MYKRAISTSLDINKKYLHALNRDRYGGLKLIDTFDLLEYQKRARETCDPKRLFELWEDVCRRYDRGEIGTYELEEMKEVILPNLKALAGLRRSINNMDDAKITKSRKRA